MSQLRKPVYVGVPVLKRYDLLRQLLVSLERSTIRPACVFIVDNGLKGQTLLRALKLIKLEVQVYTPPQNLGVAASWNWLIGRTDEERVIVNDDITFAPDSLERLLSSPANLVWAKNQGFSCFVIRDRCVEKVGLFDELISPGYGYYEDDDYLQRIDGRGTKPPIISAAEVDCGVQHLRSATLRAATPEEMAEHHRKFRIAQGNYVRKWGLEEQFERERVARELAAK